MRLDISRLTGKGLNMKPAATILQALLLAVALLACKSKGFVGTWKPEPNRSVFLQSLEIKKDGTWVINARTDRFVGTYKIVGSTLQMTEDRPPHRTAQATLEGDGRLKLIEGEKSPLYLKRGW